MSASPYHANSTWTLTGDSYITSLTCVQGSINLNGHKLYANGVEYDGENASAGEAVDVSASSSGGTGSQGQGNGNTPPAKPE